MYLGRSLAPQAGSEIHCCSHPGAESALSMLGEEAHVSYLQPEPREALEAAGAQKELRQLGDAYLHRGSQDGADAECRGLAESRVDSQPAREPTSRALMRLQPRRLQGWSEDKPFPAPTTVCPTGRSRGSCPRSRVTASRNNATGSGAEPFRKSEYREECWRSQPRSGSDRYVRSKLPVSAAQLTSP
jgi:hypothetical protein